jgi:sugar lactone lactonase YvrE
MPYDTTILLEGLWFPEAPRWHDNKLWFSDMQGLHVMAVDLDGNSEKIENVYPDGICLDDAGAVWVAAPQPGQVLRVMEGGNVTHRLNVSTRPYACMLGGPDRRTLFVCTAESSNPDEVRLKPNGKIETVQVEIPGAGIP